jgi:hypothetical protein
MLYQAKTLPANDFGVKHVEYREGAYGNGNPVYIIVTYYVREGSVVGRTYHEEKFDNPHEAQNWYDNI